jgi:putative NADPH-quinone reductase
MKVLVIHAHPVPESFNTALFHTVVATLERAGHEVRGTDLYAEGFDPVLSTAERRRYHDDAAANEAAVAGHVAALRWTEAVVFVFPTWWFNVPAMLKGYLDRVWLPGVAFHMDPAGGPISRGLPNIRKLGVVTTCGAPWWIMKFVVREPCRAVLLRSLKPLLAPRCRHVWLSHYWMDRSTPQSRARFTAKVERTFARF